METIGDRILHFRKLNGLSQKQLADLSGVRQATISDLESNKQGATKKIVEIAAALNTPAESLVPSQTVVPLEPDSFLKSASPLKEDIEEKRLNLPRLDSVSIDQAIAVAEGALLSSGIKPQQLQELRKLIRDCLKETLNSPTPEAEFASRRDIAKFVLTRFLKQSGSNEVGK